MTHNRDRLIQSQRWVVKIGTSLLTDKNTGINHDLIEDWVAQIAELKKQGMEFALVSSGSIGEGMRRLGWSTRPHEVHQLQAAASVGQMGLVQSYESVFKRYGILTAQVLLTHADFADRQRYLNARSTLKTLIDLGVVPIINENDSVATSEIMFGDNDSLAALTANLIEAEAQILLTDQDGLYNKNPVEHSDAEFIESAAANDNRLMQYAGSGGEMGRGGMLTKVQAAVKAARSGSDTLIAQGRENDILLRLKHGDQLGTYLTAGQSRLAARKQWLAGQMRASGSVTLDAGAVRVIRESGRSLLPIGVVAVSGKFQRGDIVVCLDDKGAEVARGLVNYNAGAALKIIGNPSRQIEQILGYIDAPELIHRDNIAIIG